MRARSERIRTRIKCHRCGGPRDEPKKWFCKSCLRKNLYEQRAAVRARKGGALAEAQWLRWVKKKFGGTLPEPELVEMMRLARDARRLLYGNRQHTADSP